MNLNKTIVLTATTAQVAITMTNHVPLVKAVALNLVVYIQEIVLTAQIQAIVA